jgi:CRP-like cAMP-binding protein
MDNMFVKLMRLPLFQGVSQECVASLVEKVPFHFLKFNDGEQIITEGEDCTHVRFIISGKVKIITSSRVSRVTLTQILHAPDVIDPDYLFGINTVYPFDAYAEGVCGILQLLKSDFVNMLQSDKVFLFNMLNYVSRNAQQPELSLLFMSHGLIAERLAYFVASLTTQNSRDVRLDFRQKELCSLLGARRTSLINALDELKEKGIIDYSLGEIVVKDLKALTSLVKVEVS